MRGEIGRRVFIGSAVVGVPLLTGGGAALWAQDSVGTVHTHGGPDPLEEHLIRQIARVYNDAKDHGFRGEHAREVASQLRTLAIYQRQTGRNDEVKNQLANLIADQGRDAVLSAPIDRERQAAELLNYGIELNTADLDRLPPATEEARMKALDALLANGPASAFDRVADALERSAEAVDRQAAGVRTIASLQIDTNWCLMLTESKTIVEMMVAIFCPFEAWFGAALPECIAAMSVLVFLVSLIIVSGCY